MNQSSFELIEKYSKEQMDKFGLYGWQHVQRVFRLCLKIAELERENVDLEVLKAAALLHDIAKHVQKNNPSINHGAVGAEMAEAFLRKCGFPESKIKAVCHAIRAHTHVEEPASIEAKILHDADFIDKLGAVGIATIFVKACLTNQTIEQILESFYTEEEESYVVEHISWIKKPHLYTETAKNIAEKRNKIVSLFFNQLKKEIKLEDLKSKQ